MDIIVHFRFRLRSFGQNHMLKHKVCRSNLTVFNFVLLWLLFSLRITFIFVNWKLYFFHVLAYVLYRIGLADRRRFWLWIVIDLRPPLLVHLSVPNVFWWTPNLGSIVCDTSGSVAHLESTNRLGSNHKLQLPLYICICFFYGISGNQYFIELN